MTGEDDMYEDVIPYTPAPLLQELGLKNKIHTHESRNDMHRGKPEHMESRNTRKAGTHGKPEHYTHLLSVLVVTHINPVV